LRAQFKSPALDSAISHGGAIEERPRYRRTENRAQDYEASAK
jgi:hypothetical protein